MNQRQREASHAGLARGKQAFELDQQSPGSEQQPLGMRDLARQLQRRGEARRRREERARLGQRTEGLVQLFEQRLAAALRQPFTG